MKHSKLICWASAPSPLIYCITEVYDKNALAPMNKFLSKLHGYIVYFVHKIVGEKRSNLEA